MAAGQQSDTLSRSPSVFKKSMSKMFPRLSTASDTTTNNSNAIELSPLRDRTNQSHPHPRSTDVLSTPANMLPALNTTPPLPTFQRTTATIKAPQTPRIEPTPMNTSRRRADQTLDIAAPTNISDLEDGLTPRLVRGQQCKVVGMAGTGDRPPVTERLPKGWGKQHDHLICLYDGKQTPPTEIIRRIRNFDPALRGIILPEQIDKRLRRLDQVPEIDYYRAPFGSSGFGVKAVVERAQGEMKGEDAEDMGGVREKRKGFLDRLRAGVGVGDGGRDVAVAA